MYLALARKYRPQRFADLIGQPHVTKTLQNAIKVNKIYPAMIFSGSKGIGKTSAARILAKALNCEKGPAVEPCNECSICVEITADKSPDYIEIDGASNNGVEEVRNLREKVKYKPFKNRYRIVVIDEVHMLSNSAWNALLKTIEEPPEFTYFILATTDFHKIPATIVSRCQHFEFKKIPYEVIAKLLREISDKESIKISDYALYLISRAAEGSLRDAKKILDQSIALSQEEVRDEDVAEILGIIEENIFINLTQYILHQQRREIIDQINLISERGVDLRFFYGEYLKFLRDLLVIKSMEEGEKYVNINPDNIVGIKEMLREVKDTELLRYFNALKDMELTIRNTENPRIILEYSFIKLSYLPSLANIEDVIGQIKAGQYHVHPVAEKKETMEPKISPSQSPAGSTSIAEIKISPDKLSTLLVERMEKEKPRLASVLKTAMLIITDQIVEIHLPADMEYAHKLLQDHQDYIEEACRKILNRNCQLDIKCKTREKTENSEQKIEDLKKDEKINRLLDKIKGKIISIENDKEE